MLINTNKIHLAPPGFVLIIGKSNTIRLPLGGAPHHHVILILNFV